VKREITTSILEEEQVRDELQYLIKYFSEKGFESCEILFGSFWGIYYYPGDKWYDETVKLSELEAKISEVEQLDIGSLSNDNLFVRVGGLEFLFCHESDIHILFKTTNSDVEHFYERWLALGFNPSEWIKDDPEGPGTKVR
jgi:hypothetical protein